jgi:acetyl-CoA carboxylase carboxyltransferase component
MFNAGAPGPDECEKVTSFIVLCDTYNIPLIWMIDTPGFLVGPDAEKRKMPLKVMVWMHALALATIPKISIIVRKAYGMAYLNMCGPQCGPEFIVAWPTADISFMAPEAAVNTVYFRRLQESANPDEEREQLTNILRRDTAPFKAAQKGLIDDVINPADTRKYINSCLDIIHERNGGFLSKKNLQNWPTGF